LATVKLRLPMREKKQNPSYMRIYSKKSNLDLLSSAVILALSDLRDRIKLSLVRPNP
jgi:hypothetical protein